MNSFCYYLLIIGLSLLPLINIFINTDLVHTHDGLVHLPRMGAYFKALTDGQIPVRWAGDLNFGYGMPLFNFIYQLPYFISSILMLLGLSLVNAFKMTLSLSFVLAGIFMFAFGRAFFKDDRKAFLVTLFYQFAPFRLVELLVRGSFGEVYTYAFLPLVLYGLIARNFFITALATGLLVLSHNSVSLIFFTLCLGFITFFAKNKKEFLWGSLALFTGLALSAFYWVPALFEHKYTYGDLFMKNLYLEHFAPTQNFFIPNITNDKTLQIGGVSIQIGLFHVVAILLSVGFLISRRKMDKTTKRLIVFSLIVLAASFFFTQPISKIFWENVSVLRQFQFPWRFLSVIVFATSLLSINFLFFKIVHKVWMYALIIFLVVGSTIFYWRPSLGFDKIDEGYYWNFPLNTTYYGETDVIWSGGPASSYPKQRVEIIGGEGAILNFSKKSNLHTFTVIAQTDVSLVDNTQYFPGWKVDANKNSLPIEFQDPNHRGLITFSLPKGNYDIRVSFEENKLRLTADIVSLLTLGLLLMLLIPKARRIYEI